MRTCISRRRRSRSRWSFGWATAVALIAGVAEAGLTEEWYLLRARANMQIRNYRAAVEAYRKAVEHDPDDREALKGLAVAYEANGQTDEAIGAYDRYLTRHSDDADAAFAQARRLGWSRYAYRRDDAIRYYRMGLARREDPSARHELAKLLGQKKENLADALAEYRLLLRERPRDDGLRAEYRRLLLWDRAYLDEAIDEYHALVKERPSDVSVRLQLARLLAQDPRRSTDAIAEYERVMAAGKRAREIRLEHAKLLARVPSRRADAREALRTLVGPSTDFETRLLYAQLLAAEEGSRDEATRSYAALVSARPKDASLRLEYARLLGARQDTSRDAIVHYERVLAAAPQNAEAHAGLARAWAWLGDNDRALHHGRLARRYGAVPDDVRTLEASLGMGREPRAGGGFSAVFQPGTEYALYGFRIPAHGRAELSAFVTAWADAGFEHYWGATGAASGAFAALGTEARFSPAWRAIAGLSWQSFRPGASGFGGRVAVEHRADGWSVTPRFERDARMDSFEALAGGVTSNRLILAYERDLGGWRAKVSPGIALLEGDGASANAHWFLEAGAEVDVARGGDWRLTAGLDSHTSHYGNDRGALGGYYSPAFHAVQTPRLSFEHRVDGVRSISVSGGPALQYQLLHGGGGGGFVPGGQARANASFRVAESLEWNVGGAFTRMGTAYSRFDASMSLSHVF